jgi:hypothetical protein
MLYERRLQALFSAKMALASFLVIFGPITVASAQDLPRKAEQAAGQNAADRPLPNSPSSQQTSPSAHSFWDRENLLLFAGVGVMRTLDYTSTHNMLRRGREELLIPDDVVKNDAGFAALEAASSVASIGVSYIFHHYHHHTMERWVSIVHIGVAGFGAAHNYALKTRR